MTTLAREPYVTTYDFNVAQTFRLTTPAGVSGAYISKIDLFFKKKSSSLGVEVFIVPVGEDGAPARDSVIPGSRSSLKAKQVTVSDTGTSATTFTFPAPVFLESNRPYAFVVKPMGNSPDYQIWLGESGETDLATQKPVWATPQAEQAFFASSQNNLSSLQKEDVKFRLYRAKFHTYQDGYAVFHREPDDYLLVANVQVADADQPIRVGDLAQVNTTVYGTVQSYDETTGYLVLNNSTGGFSANATLTFYREPVQKWTLGDPIANCTVESLVIHPMTGIVPQFLVQENAQTKVSFAVKGAKLSGNTMTRDSSYLAAINDDDVEYTNGERSVVGKSIEETHMSSNTSLEVRATLRTDNDFTSPIIDLRRRGATILRNYINNDITDEHTQYGAAHTKYVSKNIVLADGMEAEDLKAYVTAYRPPGTNVRVYAKVWNPEDPEEFDLKLWTPMESTAATPSYSDPKDREDFIEYEFDMPDTAGMTGQTYKDGNGVVTYDTTLASFSSFKVYAIKVVMTSSDPTKYPLLNDVRAIALQV